MLLHRLVLSNLFIVFFISSNMLRVGLTCKYLRSVIISHTNWHLWSLKLHLPPPNPSPRARKNTTWYDVYNNNYHHLCHICQRLFIGRTMKSELIKAYPWVKEIKLDWQRIKKELKELKGEEKFYSRCKM